VNAFGFAAVAPSATVPLSARLPPMFAVNVVALGTDATVQLPL
jgi:hypothetical protein